MKGRFISIFLPTLAGLFFLGSVFNSPVKASQLPDFSFPNCESLIINPGDQAHYDSGQHQIVGGDLLEGRDDVYSVGNGNFVQCFCPPNGGAEGIQTDWFRTDGKIDGWFFENGLQWNLGDYNYAAQNHNFSCVPPVGGGESTPSSSGGGGVGGGGNSAPSCPVDGKPQDVDQVWITDVTQTSLIVHWANKGDASGYQLAFGPADNKYQWGIKVGNINSFQINGIPAGLKVIVTVIPQSGDCSGNPTTSGPSVLAATGFESNLSLYAFGMALITAGIWQAQKSFTKRAKRS